MNDCNYIMILNDGSSFSELNGCSIVNSETREEVWKFHTTPTQIDAGDRNKIAVALHFAYCIVKGVVDVPELLSNYEAAQLKLQAEQLRYLSRGFGDQNAS